MIKVLKGFVGFLVKISEDFGFVFLRNKIIFFFKVNFQFYDIKKYFVFNYIVSLECDYVRLFLFQLICLFDFFNLEQGRIVNSTLICGYFFCFSLYEYLIFRNIQ